jgi:hypothetical protein
MATVFQSQSRKSPRPVTAYLIEVVDGDQVKQINVVLKRNGPSVGSKSSTTK